MREHHGFARFQMSRRCYYLSSMVQSLERPNKVLKKKERGADNLDDEGDQTGEISNGNDGDFII